MRILVVLFTFSLLALSCGSDDGVIGSSTNDTEPATTTSVDEDSTTDQTSATTATETPTTQPPTTVTPATTAAPETTTTISDIDEALDVGLWGGTYDDGDFPIYYGAVNVINNTSDWIHLPSLEIDLLIDGAIAATENIAWDFGDGIYLSPGDNWIGFEAFDIPAEPDELEARGGELAFEDPPGVFTYSDFVAEPGSFGGTDITGRIDSTWPTDLETRDIRFTFLDADGVPVAGSRGIIDRLPSGGALLIDQRVSIDLDPSLTLIPRLMLD